MKLKEIVRRFKSDQSDDIQWVVNVTMTTMVLIVLALIAFFILV